MGQQREPPERRNNGKRTKLPDRSEGEKEETPSDRRDTLDSGTREQEGRHGKLQNTKYGMIRDTLRENGKTETTRENINEAAEIGGDATESKEEERSDEN